MTEFQQQIGALYGNRIRLRVCGLLARNGRVLLARHDGIGPLGYLWAPPGGGAAFGETVADTLRREFIEETGLDVVVGDFAWFNEYIGNTLHAVELFFFVGETGGTLALGIDPEMPEGRPVLAALEWFSQADLAAIPQAGVHAVVRQPAVISRIFDTGVDAD